MFTAARSGIHFAPLFIAFRSRYPGVEITLREQGSKLLEESPLAGEIDLGASLLPVPEAFEWQSIASEPLMVLLARDHAIAARPSLTLEDLRETPSSCSSPASP